MACRRQAGSSIVARGGFPRGGTLIAVKSGHNLAEWIAKSG